MTCAHIYLKKKSFRLDEHIVEATQFTPHTYIMLAKIVPAPTVSITLDERP